MDYNRNGKIYGPIIDLNKQVALNIGPNTPCPCDCKFCFLKSNPISWEKPVPIMDAKTAGQIVDKAARIGIKQFIIGAASREPFSNKNIYNILNLVCNRYPDCEFLLPTNGVLIQDDKIDLLRSFNNLYFGLSLHTFHKPYRKHICNFDNIETIKKLLDKIQGVVFIEPFEDFEIYKNDIKTVRDLGFRGKLVVRRIEYTRYSNSDAIEISKKSCAMYLDAIQYLYDTDGFFGATPVIPHYEIKHPKAPLRGFIETEIATTKEILKKHDCGILFLTSELANQMWVECLSDMKNVTVGMIKNKYYGGSIGCASLLVRTDLENTLNEYDLKKYKLLALPQRMKSDAVMIDPLAPNPDHPNDPFENLDVKYNIEVKFIGHSRRYLI